MNDRKALERVRNRFTGPVTAPLAEACLSKVKRIAKKADLGL